MASLAQDLSPQPLWAETSWQTQLTATAQRRHPPSILAGDSALKR
jgi:hypothetical protein